MFTIEIHPPLFCVAFLVVFIITFLVRIIKRGHRIRRCYIGIIELYIMLLISVTIFPIRIIPSEMRTGKNSILDFCQLIPFKDIIDIVKNSGIINIQLIGNIILLMPMPVLIGYLSKKVNYKVLFFKSILFSFGIEIIQLIIDILLSYPSRIFDVDDIILNGIGILIGMIIFKILKEQQKIYDFIGEKIVWNTQKQ
ncbi:MAG: VanZ family protein [Lachnospiraceae bacterium]|nr:MAG: VanZ family protein [Lachnospiraceae bacterium]